MQVSAHVIPTCVKAAAYADGCAGAPTAATFQIANGKTFQGVLQANGFGTFATQTTTVAAGIPNTGDAHVSLLTSSHPEPFDVAGWDYPLGTYTAVVDPATATLPSGCVYAAGTPATLTCTSLTVSTTVQGLDMSLHGGVQFQVAGTITPGITVTLLNDNFQRGAALGYNWAMIFGSGTYNVVFRSLTYDGGSALNDNASLTHGAEIEDFRTGGTTLFAYDVFKNMSARVMNCPCYGGLRSEWSFYWDWGLTDITHNEIFGVFPTAEVSSSVAYEDFEFNTTLIDTAVSVSSSTAPWFISGVPSTGGQVTIDEVTVAFNTQINNIAQACFADYACGGGSGGASTFNTASSLVSVRVPIITAMTVEDNYVDSNGAAFCADNSGNFDFTGYIDDGQGGGSYDGVAGNILTVTSTTGGSVPIEPGAHLDRYGTPFPLDPVIQPYGTLGTTGTGGTGTYLVYPAAGGTAHITAQPSGTLDTPAAIATLTWPTAGADVNVDLGDGSTIVPGGPNWATFTAYSEATYGSTYPAVCNSSLGRAVTRVRASPFGTARTAHPR